jgi:hypothetical protein
LAGCGKPDQYVVTVDYGQTLDQMLAAAHFTYYDREYLRQCPVDQTSGQVTLTGQLYHARYGDSFYDVEEKLSDKGLRSATFPELLAWVAQFPLLPEKKEQVVLCPGSMWNTDIGPITAYVYKDGAERQARLMEQHMGIVGKSYYVLAFPRASSMGLVM